MTSNDNVIDPVCGMTISISQAPCSRLHADATHYFCSVHCALKFDVDADAYLAAARLNLPGWGMTPPPPTVIDRFLRGPAQP